MEAFQRDLERELKKELKKEGLSKKRGGGIGSLVGRLAGKVIPLIVKHGPKLLGSLGLAAATGAISGSTQKATSGSGVGDYREYGLMLSDNQKVKLRNAKSAVTLRLTTEQLSGNDRLLLTQTQINKIQRSQRKGVGMDLKLSATQISKQGGLLGLLAGLAAPLVMSVLGKGVQLPGTKQKKARGVWLPGT